MTINLNGDLTQWTLGTTFAAAASGQMTADGFRLHKAGAAIHTVRRSTDVPDRKICGRPLSYSLEVEVTTADASVGATDVTAIVYRGEGLELADIFGGRIRVRGWVKGPVGTYGLHIGNGAETLSYNQPIAIKDADDWTPFDVWAPWSGDDADWWFDSRVGYTVALVLMAGSGLQAELNRWHPHSPSAFKFSGAGQVNFNATVGNKFRLAGLRVGEGGAHYEPEDLTEMACMRHLEKSFERGWTPANSVGIGTGELQWPASVAGAAQQPAERVTFAVPKRKAATLTGYNPGAGTAGQAVMVSGATDCTATAFNQKTAFGFTPVATSPAGTAAGAVLALHWVADASLPALGTSIGG